VRAAVGALVVVVPKHSEKQPTWICITLLITCEEALGDGCVWSAVADCAAVPATCTVTLSWTATCTWLTSWQCDVQPEIWTCEMVWVVVLDSSGAGAGVVPAGGGTGFGVAGGV